MEIVIIGLLSFLGSVIGTVSGFGLSTIMVPILLTYYPPLQTLLLVGLIHWFEDLWKAMLFKEGIKWKFVIGFGLPGVIASFAGASLSLYLNQSVLIKVLAIFFIAYGVFLIAKPGFKVKINLKTQIAGGTLSGFSAGIFGISGAIRSMFLTAYDLKPASYLATGALIGIAIDSIRLVTYITGGTTLPLYLLAGYFTFIPASLLGAETGRRILLRIPKRNFRKLIAAFLILAGLRLFLIN